MTLIVEYEVKNIKQDETEIVIITWTRIEWLNRPINLDIMKIDLSTRLWGINPTNTVVIPQSLALIYTQCMVPRETVSFVFPRVLMFPSTSSRETSGLSGKQN